MKIESFLIIKRDLIVSSLILHISGDVILYIEAKNISTMASVDGIDKSSFASVERVNEILYYIYNIMVFDMNQIYINQNDTNNYSIFALILSNVSITSVTLDF